MSLHHGEAKRLALLPTNHPLRDGRTGQSSLVLNCMGQRTAHRPVWFMRQAGRSLPEYRAARTGIDMLDACLTPDVAAEITLQPVRGHGVDAAILFSDIMVPLKLAGVDVTIVPGRGPVLASPVRTADDVAKLPSLDPAALEPIAAAARIVASELGPVPLIGFAGGPFTVASYLVEGGPSRDHLRTRAMMHADPETWNALASWAAGISTAFLRAQVLAGASVVQLFDSWAGALSRADYRAFVLPHSAEIFDGVADLGIPRIHFGIGTGQILPDLAEAGADVIGIDYRTDMYDAVRRLGGRTPVQGNIDPAVVLAGVEAACRATLAALDAAADAPGHIVNLGHGVPPDADPGVLTAMVETVHGACDPRG
ncbi:MAG: uroporphyrinogen decarboxylase [Nakamurella sp.]